MGKSKEVLDRSMMSAGERRAIEAREADWVAGSGGAVGEGGEKAFDDLTDLENEDFVFVY